MGSGILGIDGEVVDGEYRLLGSSSYSQLSLRGQLTSRQCFDFLIDCASRHKKLYGYGIGFDVCHWIKDLTASQLDRLAREGRCYTELGLRFYRVTYRPNVMFKVDRLKGMPTNERGREIDGSSTVYDLMRWHRKPFADVADDWDLGTADERSSIRIIKEDRPNFSDASVAIIERYNRTECEMIAELAEEMEHGLRQLGMPVPRPFTCGATAGHLAAKHRIQDYHDEVPECVRGPIQSAFYGGREQTCRFGRFSSPRHYDIRSAYSWALAQMPDMLGEWAPHKPGCLQSFGWGLRKVRWNFEEGKYPVMPFPHRNRKGIIHYPPSGTGWHWSPLVNLVAERYPSCDLEVLDGWDYFPAGDLKPFWYMEDLHETRMALKLASDPLAGLLKFIMVSTWGRLCSDGVGHRHGHGWSKGSPTRGLVDWAGMTTSLIQARLLDAILINPNAFISCCVDGFWTDGSGPKTGQACGDWQVEKADELLLIRQSCYWKRNNRDWTAATSGIASGHKIAEEVISQWDISGPKGKVAVSDRRCNGLLQCANIGEGYARLGEFSDVNLILKLNPGMGKYGHICPSLRSNQKDWERWLPYWPPVSHPETESEPFIPKCDREMEEETLGAAAREVGA